MRKVEFKPVVITLHGVIVRCVNKEVAEQCLTLIEAQGLSTKEVAKEHVAFSLDGYDAAKQFIKVYNEINNRV